MPPEAVKETEVPAETVREDGETVRVAAGVLVEELAMVMEAVAEADLASVTVRVTEREAEEETEVAVKVVAAPEVVERVP